MFSSQRALVRLPIEFPPFFSPLLMHRFVHFVFQETFSHSALMSLSDYLNMYASNKQRNRYYICAFVSCSHSISFDVATLKRAKRQLIKNRTTSMDLSLFNCVDEEMIGLSTYRVPSDRFAYWHRESVPFWTILIHRRHARLKQQKTSITNPVISMRIYLEQISFRHYRYLSLQRYLQRECQPWSNLKQEGASISIKWPQTVEDAVTTDESRVSGSAMSFCLPVDACLDCNPEV